MRTCELDGCEAPHQAHGLCNMHYHRWTRYGDPLAVHQWAVCPGCHQRFGKDRRRSGKRLGWCTQCVSPSRLPGYVEPRYCTCTGADTPAPYPWGECPACFRLVNTEDQ